MPGRQPSRLVGHPYWETHDADEAALAFSRDQRCLRHEILTGKEYFLASHTAELDWMTFSSMSILPPQKTWAEADGRHYMLAFWLQGWSEYSFNRRQGRVVAGEGLLSSPYSDSYWKTNAERDVLAVSIPSLLLLNEAEALAGRPIPHLEPVGVLQKQGPIWRELDRFLLQLESGLFKNFSFLRSERQLRLITALNLGTHHNIQFREERAHNMPAHHAMRYDLARAYMEAHLTDAISLGNVAKAAGTSAKGLRAAFKYNDEKWSDALWRMRMQAAGRDLLAPEKTTTVKSVAQKYLFDPSRFAADYSAMFGEYPHETLQMGRFGRRIY